MVSIFSSDNIELYDTGIDYSRFIVTKGNLGCMVGGDLLEVDHTIVEDYKTGLLLVYRTGLTEIPCIVTMCEIMTQNVQDPDHSRRVFRSHTPTVHAGKSIYLLGNCSGQLP